MFCTNCGKQIGEARACADCGQVSRGDNMLLCTCGFGFHALSGDTCPDCGRANPFGGICEMCEGILLSDMNYCAKCSTRAPWTQTAAPAARQPAQQENDPEMNRAVCFCVNFIALALILVGGLVIYHGFTGSESPVIYQIAIGAVCVLLAINWIIARP
ncbi:MAG: hypothetical protein FWC71_08950 [Defluviitaleaceae bacterium]|nr:hypothetical protein [Defluviitaleaceae bacterium]